MNHATSGNVPGIQARRRQEQAGPSAGAAPLDSHRVVLHLSSATSTACRTTGYRAVRVRGDIDIIPAQVLDGFDAMTDYSSLEVLVEPALVTRVADELELPPSRARLTSVHLLRDLRLQNILFALDADIHCDAPYGEAFRDGLETSLATALLHPTTARAHHEPPLSTRALERVAQYIDANLDRPLTLTRLAIIAGVSRSSLQRAFTRWKGLPVHQYVVHRRVDRARTLLLQGRDSLTDVALMAGFSHPSHMARWMRRVLGTTPTELVPGARQRAAAQN